jgi:hypothetical protein
MERVEIAIGFIASRKCFWLRDPKFSGKWLETSFAPRHVI